MFGRSIIIAALVVYVAILGCVAIPSTSAPDSDPAFPPVGRVSREPLAGLPYRSVGMQIQRVDWGDRYKKSIDEIADLGADTVLLVVDSRQENGTSSRIYLDMRMTPNPEQLAGLIRHAKQRNLRVILMPIVLLDNPRGTEWRGTIKPESWSEWFNSYREMIKHFAWIAQGNGVDLLVVGSELVSSENHLEEWRRTIRDVRQVYKGHLTYSSNWDHYASINFWNDLDLISMNSYWKLGRDRHVKVEEIVARWKEIQGELRGWQRTLNKPLLLMEVGWCSLENAAHEPWDYTQASVRIDNNLQKKLYQGFFEAWHGTPWMGGFSIWEWTPAGTADADRGYTPEHKPAGQVLREWLAKPRWTVK